MGTGLRRSLFHHFDIAQGPLREREREYCQGFLDTSQNADFSAGRTVPGFAKAIMILQMLVILLLSSWIVEEYLNNIYLQAYVNDVLQADGSLIAVLMIISGLAVVPTTIVTGNMPVLKRANPEQDKSENSHQ